VTIQPATPKSEPRLAGWPAFVRELDATLSVHSQYVLWGNLHDSFLVTEDDTTRLLPLRDLLWEALSRSGYEFLVIYDQVDGLRVHPRDRTDAAAALLGKSLKDHPSLEGLRASLSALARPAESRSGEQGDRHRAAFLIDYASRIARGGPTELEPAEKDFFVFCEKLSRTASPVRGEGARAMPLYNPILWLTGRPGDLPAWLTADNENIREISIPRPHLGDRQQTARLLARAFGVTDPDADTTEGFALEAEGLTLQSMIEITRLAKERGHDITELPDAVRTYKLGVLDNPWRREHLRKRIVDGEQQIPARVLGQPQAVTKTLDLLKRAVLGLSGAQAARASARPRGVLFFAGPTGVGKTELAKAITTLVFGNEDAYLRFDMSEFSAEQAGERLIGAPPGYVGFEAGGELTNAIRQDPFRVILFDEIEKAHPRILDKFLQILEDGRLTDGRGNTAFFSESVLVFTSNLGMFVEDTPGHRVQNVKPGMPYEEIEHRFRDSITDHFTTVLNRPELLNRFGDNIVIFDFIGPEAAGRIFDLQLANICRRVADEHHIVLNLADEVIGPLKAWCTGELDKGGRGIGMALESFFINPLARALFDHGPASHVEVTDIRKVGSTVEVDLR
jgi:ATP-dependent Clp protease ATP-binding subunit ClpB